MEGPVVTVKQGKLQGVFVNNVLGSSRYLAFKGIPFAAPPVGELRFKDPEPPASWEGIRDASKNAGDMSVQLHKLPVEKIVGSEDCLYLNVYIPYNIHKTTKNPVMVWIHGGGYAIGTGNDFFERPDYLMAKDVIVVAINYRLGALGFLNIDHELASGNQGLKDQVAALKWIKENIETFGGDPNNITIFGNSAGSSSAHFLMLSPLSKDLFNRAILQSGIATCVWAIEEKPEAHAFKLASILGKESKDPREVIEFLKTIPATEIVKVQRTVLASEDSSEKGLDTLYADLHLFVKRFARLQDSKEITRLTEQVKKHYFINKPITKEIIPAFVQCLGDLCFCTSIKNFVDEQRKKKQAPIYFYNFSYVGNEKTFTHFELKTPPMIGASHADEMSYLFYLPICKVDDPNPPAIGTKDREMLERLAQMWSNFAKMGNPTPVVDEHVTTIWKPATADSFNYLDIGDDLQLLTITGHDTIFGDLKLYKSQKH